VVEIGNQRHTGTIAAVNEIIIDPTIPAAADMIRGEAIITNREDMTMTNARDTNEEVISRKMADLGRDSDGDGSCSWNSALLKKDGIQH